MRYEKIPAPAHLRAFVECFFIWETSLKHPLKVESPPSGFGSMVFNYGIPYQLCNFKFEAPKFVPQFFLTGQSTRNYELILSGAIGMVGIVFRPAGLGTLFNLPLAELTDERINLFDILDKNETNRIAERIIESISHTERINVLIQFLNQQLMRNEHRMDCIDLAANQIVAKKGVVNINTLMSELFMSRRQFERKFLQKVGLSPKYYARIRRMSYLCSLMSGKRQVNWQHLLYDCGYYDQAHFIKDFIAFMGCTPSNYLLHNVELTHFLKRD